MKTLSLSLLLIACVPATSINVDEERGTWKPSGKSDQSATCEGFCGGRSPGRCYCDTACTGWGDCCPDYQPVCVGGSGSTSGSGGSDGGVSDGGGTTGGFPTFDLGSGGTTGGFDLSSGTTGGFDLSSGGTTGGFPGTDLGSFSSDLGGNTSSFFSATLPATETFSLNGVPQMMVNLDVPVSCSVSPGSPGMINCGAATTIIGPGGTISVGTGSMGTLNGQILSASTVQLTDYFSDENQANGWTVHIAWDGALIVSIH